MAPNTVVLPIRPCASDGDNTKWPTADKGYTRNDAYFLERIANDKWVKDLSAAELGGPISSATWRLDRLPTGYAGFEKKRGDTLHIDRYVYGHPNGQFRSIAEFYPHFKHLMEIGGPVGCQCVKCAGSSRKRGSNATKGATSSSSVRSVSPTQSSSYFSKPAPRPSTLGPSRGPSVPSGQPRGRPGGVAMLPQGRLPSPPPASKRKQADEEGTPDVYRELIDKLKKAVEEKGEDVKVEEAISEFNSPDWKTSHEQVKVFFQEGRELSRYVPRSGEIVLFVRQMKEHETLAWDHNKSTWQKFDTRTDTWLGKPKWEAGVVTQVPTESLGDEDLKVIAAGKKSNVSRSGFRVEPLPEPGKNDKTQSKRHHYIPLHALRPMLYWQSCLSDQQEEEWHPTIRNALMISNTLCMTGKFRFKGWSDHFSGLKAEIFCRGAYIGSELVCNGDAVRLLPSPQEQSQDVVTDVLVITAVKIKLVNIREAGNDDWDDGHPYHTCLHLRGRGFTLDSARSFDGVGKVPISADSDDLPRGLSEYGQWYHMIDPQSKQSRIEVPFTRAAGRLYEDVAMHAWFDAPSTSARPSAFQAVNSGKGSYKPSNPVDIVRGLFGTFKARDHSYKMNPLIDRQAGKVWFWADTRIEALDLHEVNGRFVGAADDTRTPKQLDDWRKALKALGGNKGDLEQYDAAKKREQNNADTQGGAGYGMVGASVTVPVEGSGTGDDDGTGTGIGEDEEMADAGDDGQEGGDAMTTDPRLGGSGLRHSETIDISNDDN